MAVDPTPGFVDGVETGAAQLRHISQALLGVPFGAYDNSTYPFSLGHGVCTPTALQVAPSSPAGLKVSVAAGLALVMGANPLQGPYTFAASTATELTISSVPTGGRRDLIIAEVLDNNFGSAASVQRLTVVEGSPGSGVDPSLSAHPNALVLARLTLLPGVASISQGFITDLRSQAGTLWLARGRLMSVSPSGTTTVSSSTPTPILSHQLVLNRTLTHRRLRYRYGLVIQKDGTPGDVTAWWGSITVHANGSQISKYVPAGKEDFLPLEFDYSSGPSTGSLTSKPFVACSAGSVDVLGIRGWATVDDLGGYLSSSPGF